MSKKMKQSLFHFLLWFLVAVAFVIVFSSKGTIENWGDNKIKTVVIAFLFLVGLSGEFILRIIYRKKKNKIVVDERDEYITNKSLGAGYVITMLYIFILAITLYLKYESSGSVPVAWLWFIAYTLLIVANISSSAAALLCYWKSEK